jgi:hypothetical protein
MILLLNFFLLSCSSAFPTQKSTPEDPHGYLEAARKARENGPLEGDVRVIDGAEYIYGKNIKYMTTPYEPAYLWLPREIYTPSLVDTLPGHVGSPVRKSKEFSEFEERLARLEQAGRGGSPPKTASHENPIKDATGRTWTLYFRNDDGVEWFMDEGTLKPAGNGIELWRRMVFPRWAFQKEIVALDELNCSEERYRTHELRVIFWDGASQTSRKVTPWANVFSSSPEFYLMKVYCN